MKISELITQLHAWKNWHGDLPLSTWDGFITEVLGTPVRDGIQSTTDGEADTTPNELSLDIRCE